MSNDNKYNIVNYKWDILPYFRVEETSEWIYTFIAVELTKDEILNTIDSHIEIN